MPRWFDVHPRWDPTRALEDLRAIDAELSANGLSQPLVVGEEKYDDAAVAAAVAEFTRTSSRQVEEVMEWPLEHGGGDPSTQQTRCISPPYRIDAYASAPRERARNHADRHNLGPLREIPHPYGHTVEALTAGSYTVRVTDTSRWRGFFLGKRRTTAAFRGRVARQIMLAAGTHTFGASGRAPRTGSFNVLTPG